MNRSWLKTRDNNGRVTSMTTETGEESTFSYDEQGRITRDSFDNGISIDYAYDSGPTWTRISGTTIPTLERLETATGQLAGWLRADGSKVSFEYDASGMATATVDPLGHRSTIQHDAAGQLIAAVNRRGATTRFERDRAGRASAEVDALGHRTTFTYGPDGRVASITDHNGSATTFTRTATTVTVENALGYRTTYVSSIYGVPLKTIYADGSTRERSHLVSSPGQDATSYPLFDIDEEGRARTYTYSTRGEMESATDLAGNMYRYRWAPKGGLAGVDWPSGRSLGYTYDELSRIRSVQLNTLAPTAFEYDPAGNLHRVLRPSGNAISYEFDLLRRQQSRQTSDGNFASYSWNANDARESMTDSHGTTRFTYNEEGDLSRIAYPDGTSVAYEYDLVGKIAALDLVLSPGSSPLRTRYSYDPNGNLTGVTDPLGGTTTITYDAANRKTQRTLPNGVTTTFEYDERNRLTRIRHRTADGIDLFDEHYTLLPTGEPSTIVNGGGSSLELTYDEALRIASEHGRSPTGATTHHLSYTYDSDGNRTTLTSSTTTSTFHYDSAFALSHVSGGHNASFVTDADGRVSRIIRDGHQLDFTYNVLDQLVAVDDPSIRTSVHYNYDADGRRYGVSGETSRSLFIEAPRPFKQQDAIHAVVSNTGSLLAAYVYA